MKFKVDFVTNSSSASFILHIESTANDYDDFIKSWERYLEDFCHNYGWKISEQVKKYRKELENSYNHDLELRERINNKTANEEDLKWYTLFRKHQELKDPKLISDKDIIKDILGGMSITKSDAENMFSVEYSTSMFNNICEDIPDWMLELIVLNNMGAVNVLKYGIKSVHLEIDEDNN